MEAELIKENNFYKLIQNNTILAKISTNESINIHYSFGKLSLKNCQAIERGYDLDGLAEKACPDVISSAHSAYKAGFQKALEILGDKKYSEDDIRKAILLSMKYNDNAVIQSLQQTEWDVEIVIEDVFVHSPSLSPNQKSQWEKKPKLDADGCLILKRK